MCSNSFLANFCTSSTSVFIYCNIMLQVSAQIVLNFISQSISYVISSSVSNILLYIFITECVCACAFFLRSKIENAH